jgi:hypothetical protein
MTRIHILVSIGVLALLAGGCTTAPEFQGPPDLSDSVAEQVIDYPLAGGLDRQAPASCVEEYGFAVLDFRAIRDLHGRVSVVGEIKNTGFAARGVELQATLRDADGRIVAVGHFHPAPYRNIQREESLPFSYSFGSQEEAVLAELRIVGAFRTMDMLNIASLAR